MYVCFLLTLQLLSFHMQIGLKAEAIGKKKSICALFWFLRCLYIDTPVTSSCLLALLVKVLLSRTVEHSTIHFNLKKSKHFVKRCIRYPV